MTIRTLVETTDELNALPVGSVVVSETGVPYFRVVARFWDWVRVPDGAGVTSEVMADTQVLGRPFTVLHRGGAA